MIDIYKEFSSAGLLKSENFKGKPLGEQITTQVIIARFRSKKQVPKEILIAIELIGDPDEANMASNRLLRIVIFARTIIQTGDVLFWFQNAKVLDAGSETKIPVSIIKVAANDFIKLNDALKRSNERADELESNKKRNSKQQISLDKAVSRAESLKDPVDDAKNAFLLALNKIYLALASERK